MHSGAKSDILTSSTKNGGDENEQGKDAQITAGNAMGRKGGEKCGAGIFVPTTQKSIQGATPYADGNGGNGGNQRI